MLDQNHADVEAEYWGQLTSWIAPDGQLRREDGGNGRGDHQGKCKSNIAGVPTWTIVLVKSPGNHREEEPAGIKGSVRTGYCDVRTGFGKSE